MLLRHDRPETRQRQRYRDFPRHFVFNHTATTEIYPLSLHDALPIFGAATPAVVTMPLSCSAPSVTLAAADRKSTRLNSSHRCISYAVFCLKKKKRCTNSLLPRD